MPREESSLISSAKAFLPSSRAYAGQMKTSSIYNSTFSYIPTISFSKKTCLRQHPRNPPGSWRQRKILSYVEKLDAEKSGDFHTDTDQIKGNRYGLFKLHKTAMRNSLAVV